MNISNLENFPDCIISPKEQNFCERASVSLELTIRNFLASHKLYKIRKTDLLSKTLYFISSNMFSSLYNLKTEIISILDSTTYFSLVFTICCLFLYRDNIFISPTDISKVFYQHNYSKAKNPEIFLDNIIESFSEKTTKKYQLTRTWDILEIFRNLELGVPVPVYLNDDSNKSKDRYALLIGIDNEYAVLLDSNFVKNNFICYCPIEEFLDSLISSQGLTCAWDFRNLFLD